MPISRNTLSALALATTITDATIRAVKTHGTQVVYVDTTTGKFDYIAREYFHTPGGLTGDEYVEVERVSDTNVDPWINEDGLFEAHAYRDDLLESLYVDDLIGAMDDDEITD